MASFSRTLLVVSAISLLAGSIAQAIGPVVSWYATNTYGQATLPGAVSGITGLASAIGAERGYSCAIQEANDVILCWGGDAYGVTTPPPSVDGTAGTASAIAVGDLHSCAIQSGTGAVVCWGMNNFGQATPPPSVDGSSGSATAVRPAALTHARSRRVPVPFSAGAGVVWPRRRLPR